MNESQDQVKMGNTTPGVSPRILMDICNGFWSFKALATSHELGLFELLHSSGSLDIADTARHLNISERPAEMLLTAMASLGVLEVRQGRYRNTAVAEEFLLRGGRFYFGGWITHLDHRSYPGWGRLKEAVLTNSPTTWSPESQKSFVDGEKPELLVMFQDGMHSLSRYTAAAVAGALDFSDAKMVLDVGGGTGAYAVELAERHPHLNVTVFDIEPVCEKARVVIDNSSVADRVAVVAGDFFEDKFLAGFDTIILSMILHDWSPDDCRRLLRACAGALPSGGRLIISELLVDDDKSGPADAALMSLNMLVRTWGRNYTAAEYSSWLVEAGFHAPKRIPLDGVSANGLLVAERS